MAGSIVDQILNTVSERLSVGLTAPGVPSQELASVVRPGLAQQDPVADRISVFLHHGDPDDVSIDPKWSDKTVQEYGKSDDGFAAFMLGGSTRWWRCFVIEIKCYFVKTKETREEARRIAQTVFGRAHRLLTANPGLAITDDFGETAILLIPDRITSAESGGPPSSFNWRGKIYFRVLTETAPML